MTTPAQVAIVAGVSPSAVSSHVINGTRHVNEGTARAVHEAIDALGYRPNAVARSFARASTSAVGVVMAMGANRYFTDIACAVERACGELGQVVFLVDSDDDSAAELEALGTVTTMDDGGLSIEVPSRMITQQNAADLFCQGFIDDPECD